MALSEEERVEAERVFREELEAEHGERLEALEKKRDKLRAKRETREQRQKNIELEELRTQLRDQFFLDKGYRRYTDSRGREHWLSPEEYDWRMSHRRRRRKRRFRAATTRRLLTVGIYVGILLLAVVLGILMTSYK